MGKNFKLKPDDIEIMVPNLGGAIATDKITLDGNRVDFMRRTEPDREEDSGWEFYGGGETQEYIDNPDNSGVYAVNTICKYDPDIIPFLTYPPGTEIERNEDGRLELIDPSIQRPSTVFMQPVTAGRVHATRTWSFEILSRMLRRVDDGSLVIWRPGFTIWLNAYGADLPIQARLENVLQTKSPEATDLQQAETPDGWTKLRYSLTEESPDAPPQRSVSLFGFSAGNEIHMSIYYDDEEFMEDIDVIWGTLGATPS